MNGYIPRFFVKKGVSKRVEYYQMNIGHVEIIKDIKHKMRGWFVEKGADMYLNML